MTRKRTDNADMDAKLGLRRWFLNRYHGGQRVRVIDCCAGLGRIWGSLRKEYDIDYWPLDVKPIPGVQRIASERLLAMPGWQADVVDVDTYGQPWKHWLAMLPNAPAPLTVFLTSGRAGGMNGRYGNEIRRIVGWQFEQLDPPPMLLSEFADIVERALLSQAANVGLRIADARFASSRNARYLGLRLEKA